MTLEEWFKNEVKMLAKMLKVAHELIDSLQQKNLELKIRVRDLECQQAKTENTSSENA